MPARADHGDMTSPAENRRIAVIVTPGVGDDERGATLDAFVDGLLRSGYFASATSDDVTVPPPPAEKPLLPRVPDETAASPCRGRWSPWARHGAGSESTGPQWVSPPKGSTIVARRRLRRPPGSGHSAREVDAYEMHWADLSRFPVGLRRIIFTLFALVLELGRMGRQALAGLSPSHDGRALTAACLSLRGLSTWMALAVIPITALVGILGVALTVALFAPSEGVGSAFALVVAVGGIVLLIMIGRGLIAVGWDPPLGLGALWPVAVSGGALIGTWAAMLLTGIPFGSSSANIANFVVATAAWPLRLAWLALIVLWVSSAIWTLVLILRAGDADNPARRAGVVALLSGGVPAVLLGVVSAITLGAASTVSIQALGDNNWGGGAKDLMCLESADSWSLESCLDLRDTESASELFTPREWLVDLFGTVLEPLGVAGALLSVTALFALVILFLFTLWSLVKAMGERVVPEWVRHYVPLLAVGKLLPEVGGVSGRLGDALSRLLRRPLGSWGLMAVVVLSGLVAGVTLVSWLIVPVGKSGLVDLLLEGPGADFIGAVTAMLAFGLIAARFLPGGLASSAGGFFGPLRRALDIIGDVSNYIRPHRTSPRFDIVARYRALIDHVATMPHGDGEVGYGGLVLVSHSQGTVYTAATLYGDTAREPAIYPLSAMGEADSSSALESMERVAMLTFGSPIQQTYNRFFAGQYEPWIALRGPELAPVTTAWINAYRPGDYVGRTIHGDAIGDLSLLVPGENPVLIEGERPEIIEYCLDSTRSHTGYWTDADIATIAEHLIERVAGCDANHPRLATDASED